MTGVTLHMHLNKTCEVKKTKIERQKRSQKLNTGEHIRGRLNVLGMLNLHTGLSLGDHIDLRPMFLEESEGERRFST